MKNIGKVSKIDLFIYYNDKIMNDKIYMIKIISFMIMVVPALNPLLALLGRVFMYLILPVPYPFLLTTFYPHPVNLLIVVEGNPQAAHLFFYLWKVVLPHLLH